MIEQSTDRDRLYDLLPAVYRERDAAQGYQLQALLEIVAEQATLVQNDVAQLWDDFFIETCRRWVTPYIGDLVGNRLLHDARPSPADDPRALFADLTGPTLLPEPAVRLRADVANTIFYRRRKGTVAMLEALARDVTGWAAHVVEFFEELVWSQNLNHLRLFSTGCPDLRSIEAVDRLDGPFDPFSHTVDVRPPAQSEGWYNIRNIGFFLWRLESFGLVGIAARAGGTPWQYTFSPLGNPAPLFTNERTEPTGSGLSREIDVPGPIRPAAFYTDLTTHQGALITDFYAPFEADGSGLVGQEPGSFYIRRDGVDVPAPNVHCANLATWHQPTGNVVGVDVRLGRMAFGTTFVPTQSVEGFYHYGFSGNLGGGPYRRTNWLVDRALAQLVIEVQQTGAVPTIADALTQWQTAGKPDTIISIVDNATYEETISIEPADGHWLVIEAQDGQRPHVRVLGGELDITGDHPDAGVTFSGLLVEGWIHVTGSLGTLRVLHATLVPGRALNDDGTPASTAASLVVDPGAPGAELNTDLQVQLAYAICGPLRVPENAAGLLILDSIVDGLPDTPGAGPALAATDAGDVPAPIATIQRTTVFGPCFVKQLALACECIFTQLVTALQVQEGCVRFSYVPPGSKTPRRYRCQPDLEIATEIEALAKQLGVPPTAAQQDAVRARVEQWLIGSFTSTQYGQPAYAQLRLSCPSQIRTGAADESEMGAFCFLKQPQRETNLRVRLEEYLPFGLDPAIIFVT